MIRDSVSSASQSGFTLLEVLVALSVFAMSYGAIMQVVGAAARSAQVAGEYRVALAIAESRLALARANGTLALPQLPLDDPRGYRVHVSTEPYAEGDAAAVLFRPELVTVTVSWTNGERAPHTISLSTLRLRVGSQ